MRTGSKLPVGKNLQCRHGQKIGQYHLPEDAQCIQLQPACVQQHPRKLGPWIEGYCQLAVAYLLEWYTV